MLLCGTVCLAFIWLTWWFASSWVLLVLWTNNQIYIYYLSTAFSIGFLLCICIMFVLLCMFMYYYYFYSYFIDFFSTTIAVLITCDLRYLYSLIWLYHNVASFVIVCPTLFSYDSFSFIIIIIVRLFWLIIFDVIIMFIVHLMMTCNHIILGNHVYWLISLRDIHMDLLWSRMYGHLFICVFSWLVLYVNKWLYHQTVIITKIIVIFLLGSLSLIIMYLTSCKRARWHDRDKTYVTIQSNQCSTLGTVAYQLISSPHHCLIKLMNMSWTFTNFRSIAVGLLGRW